MIFIMGKLNPYLCKCTAVCGGEREKGGMSHNIGRYLEGAHGLRCVVDVTPILDSHVNHIPGEKKSNNTPTVNITVSVRGSLTR